MRVWICLLGLVLGCTYETNYYGAEFGDGGAVDMAGYTDEFGDYHDEGGSEIFREGSKLYGDADLLLQPIPAFTAGFWGNLWPQSIFNTPARAGAQVLVDVDTKGGKPYVFTVSLGDVARPWDIPTTVANLHTETVAIIEYGVGGFTAFAEVDFVRGVQFTLEASHLRIYGVYRYIPGSTATVATPPTCHVGASLAVGVIAHGRQPQRTLARWQLPAVAAGGVAVTDTWFIPTFAKSFRVTDSPNNSQVFIEVRDWAGAVHSDHNMVASPTVDIPLGSPLYFISFSNLNGLLGAAVTYNAVFELAF